ncbi:hypothetical protein AUC71_04755 [Methyloceanibacter marginalis]|uniref:Uncharacterized protein n=1 Tax=Methyloceanibacter marginalis TaxID=1774971 RepID=A0A1E3VS25_9HYPH|nr:hypothetical protein [Methyloceanibacter marginalis]ODR96081.1 hypothetical protein AUC71_04755 [Methyloceanibacter marginalis]
MDARIKSGHDEIRFAGRVLRGLGCGVPAHVRGCQVRFHQRAVMGGVGQQVDMHLVGADLRARMTQMGKIERDRVVLGVAEGSASRVPSSWRRTRM